MKNIILGLIFVGVIYTLISNIFNHECLPNDALCKPTQLTSQHVNEE